MKMLIIALFTLVTAATVALHEARVEGGDITLSPRLDTSVYCSYVMLTHCEVGTDGYDDSIDTILTLETPPAINFYSMIPGYTLSMDVRPLGSISTFHTKMAANGITGMLSGDLQILFNDYDGAFGTLPIYSDIYKNDSLVLGNIDVRQYAQNGTTIPLSLADGDYYNIDVRFIVTPEPSALTLFGIGAGLLMVFGWWRRRW
jgi:hypothetical protein